MIFADKEEVGSVGATGMNTRMLENFASQTLSRLDGCSEPVLRQALERSEFISADVIAGFDSNYPSAFEPDNSARLGHGPVLIKYTGQNGKKGSNAASAEFLAALRDTFDDADVCWQLGEMGKIDLGGGGTIAPAASCVSDSPGTWSVLSFVLPSSLVTVMPVTSFKTVMEARPLMPSDFTVTVASEIEPPAAASSVRELLPSVP